MFIQTNSIELVLTAGVGSGAVIGCGTSAGLCSANGTSFHRPWLCQSITTVVSDTNFFLAQL